MIGGLSMFMIGLKNRGLGEGVGVSSAGGAREGLVRAAMPSIDHPAGRISPFVAISSIRRASRRFSRKR
jgi:hypothetical protein